MLSKGSSQPWPDVLQELTGSRRMDASALLEYFRPLHQWLERQNEQERLGWTRQCPDADHLRRASVEPPQATTGQSATAARSQTSARVQSPTAAHPQPSGGGQSATAAHSQTSGGGQPVTTAGSQISASGQSATAGHRQTTASGQLRSTAESQRSGCDLVAGRFGLLFGLACLAFVLNRLM